MYCFILDFSPSSSSISSMVAKKDHLTPYKNKSTTSSSSALDAISFLTTPLVQAVDVLAVSPLDPDTLFPLLFFRIDMLQLSSKKLRTGLVDYQKTFADIVQSLGIKVELLRDNLGFDPGFTDVFLCSIWESIFWVKSSLSDALQTALPVLLNIASPLSHQEV